MKKKNNIKWLFLILFLLITSLICGLSLSTGEVSSLQSGLIVNLIKSFFDYLGVTLSAADMNALSFLIRKGIGHFAIFLLDAIFGWLTLKSFFGFKGWTQIGNSALLVLLVALGSEGLQLLTSGRAGLLSDVAVDMSGAIFGIALCYVFSKQDQLFYFDK
jgi:VanZ family protein